MPDVVIVLSRPIEELRGDYLITSIGAIEHDGALQEFDVNETLVARTMMKHTRNTLLVADHTQFTASAAVSIGNARKVQLFFTDAPTNVIPTITQ